MRRPPKGGYDFMVREIYTLGKSSLINSSLNIEGQATTDGFPTLVRVTDEIGGVNTFSIRMVYTG